MLRPLALGGQERPSGDDEHGTGDERCLDRLVQEDERDGDRKERTHPDDDRCPRRPGFPYGECEQELRDPRPEQPRDQERPDIGRQTALREGERQHDADRDEHREERSTLGERAPLKGDTHRDSRGTEQDSGR